MKNSFIVLVMSIMLVFVSCTKTAPITPTPPVAPAPAPVTPKPDPVVIPPSGGNSNLTMDQINKIVVGSSCSKYAFGNRGPAPKGYLKGVVVSYARTLCLYNSPNKTYAGAIGKVLGTDAADALTHYGFNADTGGERIKQTYTLLIGLGLRESSGQYGTGWDRSKLPEIQPSANNSETGLFQVSYDNNSKMPDSAALYLTYKAQPDKCSLDIFKEGASAVQQDFVGKPSAGYDFQYFMRYCPALQVDYAAAGIRVNRKQWGPLNRKEAEYYKPCEQMLSQVEAVLTCN